MNSNPTICEEKLTTNNPNRKWGFIEKQICFFINPHFLYIYIYIYTHTHIYIYI